MKNLRKQINDLACQISNDVDHGECFYDYEMFNDFIESLDEMKKLALRYYSENKAEMENE